VQLSAALPRGVKLQGHQNLGGDFLWVASGVFMREFDQI